MKKLILLTVLLQSILLQVKADHITGGEIFYTYSPGTSGIINYNVTFKLFMRCNSNREFYNPAIVSIFDKVTNARIRDLNVTLSSAEIISITNPDPCITNPPSVCYNVGYYNFTVSLPASENGFVLASQVNYRINGINNMTPGYTMIGATYTAEIPGTRQAISGPVNNSARFTGSDLVVVCANNRFSYSFGATDTDGDILRYSFCGAYRSGSSGNQVVAPPSPPFATIPYGNNYGVSNPLGNNVQINSSTGLITGTAPGAGVYVVTVCVEEIRDGKVIATQRKDLQLNIAPCNIAAAVLEPAYSLCKSTTSISIRNLSNSPLINTYYWELSTRGGTPISTSTDPLFNYTFADTGTYSIKLIINRNAGCSDSTTSIIRVYPGFVPGFSVNGICFTKPTTFIDNSTSVYGTVNSWDWTLGPGILSDQQNPVTTYSTTGIKSVQLIVTNTVGCRDTISKQVSIFDKPPINLNFTDTLICKGDAVQMVAQGSGNYTWSPTTNMTGSNTSSPTVKPTNTTTYNVTLNDQGCINTTSVQVRVTDTVHISMIADTTICRGDTIQINVQSDAFVYSWTPANQVLDPNVQNPFVVTNNTRTIYNLTAKIGSCVNSAQVSVSTIPYPTAFAGNDTTICFNTKAQLKGSSNGTRFNWSPTIGLSNSNILNPLASPSDTIAYILFAYDTLGCPKPKTDTVLVKVLPLIKAFAGRDTAVVVAQPLQLNATGGQRYLWSPAIGLSAINIPDPVATYSEPYSRLQYKVLVYDDAGCKDSAFVAVKVFVTGPSVFVPTAFTPNGDGKNDVLRPVAAGIKEIEMFNIYNRWGQLVFSTRINGNGWDGTINGLPQATGVFVWQVKAIDFNNIPYFQKGTVMLIK